jgi:hemoglobin
LIYVGEMVENLYKQIGREFIERAITEFYVRAFKDPIIGHFFFEKDRQDITNKQIAFATSMLGGPDGYQGRPLRQAHEDLSFRRPHFGRRQVLMTEVLTDLGLDDDLKAAWLAKEQKLAPLVLGTAPQKMGTDCQPS